MGLIKQAEIQSRVSDDCCRDMGEEPYYYKCSNCGGVETPYCRSIAQSLVSCVCDNRNMIKILKR